MRRSWSLAIVSLVAMAGAIAACTLNPQPLPPANPDGGLLGSDDAGTRSADASVANNPTPQDGADAGGTTGGFGGSPEGGDAGASIDASSDAEVSDASDATDQ
jgi:hypothetical protein